MIGGGVGHGVPAEDANLGITAAFDDPRQPVVATGLVGNGKARARRWAVVGMPALAGGGLLDLNAERPTDLGEIESLPVPRAQRPFGLQRQRHYLLNPLAADRISEEWCAEEAVGQACGDVG